MIKKLLIAALIIAHTPAYSFTLPAYNKKKVLGIGKIALGTWGTFYSLGFSYASFVYFKQMKYPQDEDMNTFPTILKSTVPDTGYYRKKRNHSARIGLTLLPLSIISIMDGIRDLKESKQQVFVQ